MRGPMTLVEQVNAFRKSNRQHLIIDRTARQRLPVYSPLKTTDSDNVESKMLSLDVYTSKHLVNNAKSMLTMSSERSRLNEPLLPSIPKNLNHDANHRRRKRKRPLYRKSLFHSYLPIATPTDLTQLNARGTKPELHVTIPTDRDNDTVDSPQRDHAPPPSPSDAEIERLLDELQDRDQSRQPSPQLPVEKEEYVPFRLPILRRSARFRRTPINTPSKDIRSTLSNYLQKYY